MSLLYLTGPNLISIGFPGFQPRFLPLREVMEGGEEAHSLPPKTPTINSVTSLHTASRVMAKKPVKGQDRLGGSSKKKRYFLGIFPKRGEGGHPISQNFCKITKSFLACQIHPKVLKHVFYTGGSNI